MPGLFGDRMIQSTNNPFVFYALPGELVFNETVAGGWHYINESGKIEHYTKQAFATEQDAIDDWAAYTNSLANQDSPRGRLAEMALRKANVKTKSLEERLDDVEQAIGNSFNR